MRALFGFKRLQYRLLFYFLGLLVVLQTLTTFAVDRAAVGNAKSQVSESLTIGARVFRQLMAGRSSQLAEMTRILSMDYAFKTAIRFSDHPTTLSVLENLKGRIGADVVWLISIDHVLIADTLHPDAATGKSAVSNDMARVISGAEANGEATSIIDADNLTYQVVVVPMLAPDPIAWLCIGFRIDAQLLVYLKQLIQSQITILRVADSHRLFTIATTLDGVLEKDLVNILASTVWESEKSIDLPLERDQYVTYVTTLEKKQEFSIIAVIQRPFSEVLKPYERLKTLLINIFATGFVLSILVSLKISHTVTRPVNILVNGVREILKGNYSFRVDVKQADEVGELASAFNNMSSGLEEKERVSDLLGKVVSPAIAHELMNKKVELGGEEVEVTILFADIRNFTAISENRPPKSVLNILNMYLTKMSGIIEENGGVIDKYIGDAVMALYGAPLKYQDAPDRAINTALAMLEALDELNERLESMDMPRLGIGVGINTGIVVAGNMGSERRLNYTVIGDTVNLAARLEDLTRNEAYGANIIVSEETLAKAKGRYATRPLGQVTVKGKKKVTQIHALTDKPARPFSG
ncbi:MAG: HAMP domain-containing protein [Nitrospirae bacterium]|nr:HAMP domain-containing protein [Nitrospirota bacterium]